MQILIEICHDVEVCLHNPGPALPKFYYLGKILLSFTGTSVISYIFLIIHTVIYVEATAVLVVSYQMVGNAAIVCLS